MVKMKRFKAKRFVAALALMVALSFCLAMPGAYAEESEPPTGAGDETSAEPPEGAAEEASGETAGGEDEEAAGDESGDPAGDTDADTDTDADADTGADAGAGGGAGKNNTKTADDLRSNIENVNGQLDQAKNEYDAAVAELKSLEERIAVLEVQIKDKEEEIEDLQGQIDENRAIILELTQQIVELDAEVFDQNSVLNKRLRVMYMTDDESMLAVLLGSESFVDFLSNIEMVRKIHESDKAFLAELEEKLDELERKRAEVLRIEGMLKEQQEELQTQKDQLDADKAALAAAKQRVKEIRDAAAADIDRLEAESNKLKAELANMISQWGDYFGGAMAWPVLGPITSEFGMRYHPITGRYVMHNGLDIGVPYGTAVHAGAPGIVYFAGWNGGGYGYLVILDNGSGITTMYAHNSSIAVSKGQVVARGDVIAYAGSTGNSTGPHVHFEVRKSGAPDNPRNWLG